MKWKIYKYYLNFIVNSETLSLMINARAKKL
ncbi:hypothetical protein CUP1637 [Campylobacter upsaliensis RM3195]|nr:hypothetical protein CUP1637 [Campylobacter upsaliensis RM3195]